MEMKVHLKKSAQSHIVVLLIVCALVASEPQWHTASDGTRYLIEPQMEYNWLEANDECAQRGLQLVDVDTAAEYQALEDLVRSLYGTSRIFWLGYHDEFSAERSTERPFFSVSTGKELTFSNWYPGEPMNMNGVEHCVYMWDKANLQWNDGNCEASARAFICEDHHLTVKYHKETQEKRFTANGANAKLASKFATTQSEINEINAKARSEADRLLVEFEQSTEQLIADLKNALNEIVEKKPYLEAVVADVAQSFKGAVVEKEQEFAKLSNEVRQSMGSLHEGVESSTNVATVKFSQELTTNANEIDKLFD